MFTNIPINETIDIISKRLKQTNTNTQYIKEITNILNTILHQNYFTYNLEIYEQKDGLAMGAPTSNIISEAFLQNIDNKIISIIHNHDKNSKYYRYVDDALYISQNNGSSINEIMNEINKIHNNIQFTVDKEDQNKIHYLDLTIINEIPKFQYTVYRKPTQTSLTIPYNSYHPPQHKMAAYNALIYRMLKIPLTTNERNKERNIIHQIANNNGYETKTIQKLENKIKNKLTKKNTVNETNAETKQTYTTLTYNGTITKKLAKIFKKVNINISYKTDNTIYNKLITDKNTEEHNKNGVYKIECPDCNKFYIGQTKKRLKDRFTQHFNAFKKPMIYKSNLATHSINNNHTFPNIKHMSLIKNIHKGTKMNIWENLEIFKHNDNNKLIEEQTQIRTKQDKTFQILKLLQHTSPTRRTYTHTPSNNETINDVSIPPSRHEADRKSFRQSKRP